MRSGWELVRADEYPDRHLIPRMKDGKYAGVIGVGGLVLARIPEEVAKAREEYFQETDSRSKDNAVNNDLMKEAALQHAD